MSSSSFCLGLLRIGVYEFAVPASMVQHVIQRPVMTPLPDPGQLATGSFLFAGSVVPAMDIAAIFSGQPQPAQARPLLAIMRQGDNLLGLEIDGFRKVINCPEDALSRLFAHEGENSESMPLFPRHFWDTEIGGTVGILDTGVLLRTEGVRSTQMDAGQGEASAATETAFLHLALFQVNGRTFGIHVDYVRQALYAGKITTAEHCGVLLYGHYIEGNTHTPIVRLLDLLQLPSLGGDAKPQRGLVIGAPATNSSCSLPDAGFLIENVAATIKVPCNAIHSLANSGIPRNHLYAGVLFSSEYGHVVVLNGDAVLREIAGGREVSRQSLQEQVETIDDHSEPVMYIVYRVGRGSLASLLKDVEAVVPATGIFPMGTPGSAFVGLMPWREHRVNLLDLGVLTGREACLRETACEVLITQEAGTYYGFLVSQVESMVSAKARPSPVVGRREASGTMIEVLVGSTRQNVLVLELRQSIQSVSLSPLS